MRNLYLKLIRYASATLARSIADFRKFFRRRLHPIPVLSRISLINFLSNSTAAL
jgi:hypothetical protein